MPDVRIQLKVENKLNEENKKLTDKVLNREYKSSKINEKVKDLDSYNRKLERYLERQDKKCNDLIGKINDFHHSLNKIFYDYDFLDKLNKDK